MSLQTELEAARKKVVKDGYDMSIGELISLYKSGELVVNPAFQRLYRWDVDQKTRFIESLLLGIPVPPVFVFTTERSNWELVDGLQRLSTVFEFVGILKSTENLDEQPLRLQGTKLLPSLSGKAWEASVDAPEDGLTPAQQLDVKRTRIRVEILKKESDEQAKFELFQRLNTGGSPLSEQEVRDCVMVMIDKTFFDWVRELASAPVFTTTIEVTERDRQQQRPRELCLRFLSYMEVPYDGKLGLHDYLNEATITLAKSPNYNRVKYTELFNDVFTFLNDTMGRDAFRKWNGENFLGAFSISAYEAIVIGVARNIETIRRMTSTKRKKFIENRIRKIWFDDVFLKNSGAGVRGTQRLSNLIPHAAKYFA